MFFLFILSNIISSLTIEHYFNAFITFSIIQCNYLALNQHFYHILQIKSYLYRLMRALSL